MALTQSELQARSQRIGASDVPIIVMGDQYPWIQSYNTKSLWMEKMGRSREREQNEAMAAGDLLEPSFRRFVEQTLGPVTTAADTARSILPRQILHPNGVMLATLDARFVDKPWLCEFKSTGQTNPFWDRNRWGQNDTVVEMANQCSHIMEHDEDGHPVFSRGAIPAEHYWQIQAQIACANAWLEHTGKTPLIEGVCLTANLPGTSRPFRNYLVRRNDRDIMHLQDVVCDWWDKWMVTEQEPDGPLTPYTAGLLRIVEGQGQAPDEMFLRIKQLKSELEPLRAKVNRLDKEIKEAEAQLIDAGGANRTIVSPSGHVLKLVHVEVARDEYSYDRKSYKFKE